MTEGHWRWSTKPQEMLSHLLRFPTGDVSGGQEFHPHHPGARKLLLLAGAVERQWLGPLAVRGGHRAALVRLEAIADGRLPPDVLADVALSIAGGATPEDVALETVRVHDAADDPLRWADYLRELVGNPWRPLLHSDQAERAIPGHYVCACGQIQRFDPGEERRCRVCQSSHLRKRRRSDRESPFVLPRAWLTPGVTDLAGATYRRRTAGNFLDQDLLGALADALERAGAQDPPCPVCQDETIVQKGERLVFWGDCPACGGHGTLPILRHLREPGPHLPGCFVLDAILNKP